jgi:uncharacterized OsmC-like protein
VLSNIDREEIMSGTPIVKLTHQTGYQFLIDFGLDTPDLIVDEPPPLGGGAGPTPSRLLLAGIANCLVFSLLTALTKHQQDAPGLTAIATARTERNDAGRIRIVEVTITIRLGKADVEIANLETILGSFEQFSTISQSVQQGIQLHVCVEDVTGKKLKD